MDFWARGAFHRARRIAKADAAPNVVRKAARRVRNQLGNDEYEYEYTTSEDQDEYIEIPAIVIGPRKRRS